MLCAGMGLFMRSSYPSFRGASAASEPGIQRQLWCLHLDSGSAPSARPGMTGVKDAFSRRHPLLAERDGEFHRLDDLHVTGAAADVAAERLQNFVIARIGVS